MADLGLKAINLEDPFNPLRNLWRNVLIVSIEDAIKIKRQVVQYKELYEKRRFHELDYVSLPNRDFDAVCSMAELDGSLVRKKVNALLERMESNDNDMPTMPWKRLYQSKGIYRESDGNHTAVSAM
jgi:hypothetical protein|tara:strand:- start:664 stop:1041 length:378 start_codon:yes stop_codon:yes gene_type:complete